MMLLRDETPELLNVLRNHQEALAGLLNDDYVGIGPLAADLFRAAADQRLDIGPSVPGLKAALDDIYVKRNAAAALAIHFMNTHDDASLDGLLAHPDADVVRSVQLVLMRDAVHA